MFKVFKQIFLLIISSFFALASPLQALEKAPDWSYRGEGDPSNWGSLQAEFVTCKLGSNQSPIDINNIAKNNPHKINFNYLATPLNIVNTGKTIQINYQQGSNIIIDRKKYELLQFHFHSPSEHAIEGKTTAMELHLVHRNSEGQLAVIGIEIERGEANPVIEKIWQNIPQGSSEKLVSNTQINAKDFLPQNTSYFSYIGSLTTPPCTENVLWNVLQEPISLSEQQIATFESLYRGNARPVQSVNGRTIEFHP